MLSAVKANIALFENMFEPTPADEPTPRKPSKFDVSSARKEIVTDKIPGLEIADDPKSSKYSSQSEFERLEADFPSIYDDIDTDEDFDGIQSYFQFYSINKNEKSKIKQCILDQFVPSKFHDLDEDTIISATSTPYRSQSPIISATSTPYRSQSPILEVSSLDLRIEDTICPNATEMETKRQTPAKGALFIRLAQASKGYVKITSKRILPAVTQIRNTSSLILDYILLDSDETDTDGSIPAVAEIEDSREVAASEVASCSDSSRRSSCSLDSTVTVDTSPAPDRRRSSDPSSRFADLHLSGRGTLFTSRSRCVSC